MSAGEWICLGILIVLTVEDVKSMTVTAWIPLTAGAAGVVFYFVNHPFSCRSLLAGAAAGGILILAACMKHQWIGMGDGLTFAATGVWLGGRENLSLLMLSFLTAAVAAAWMLIRQKADKTRQFPFLPCVLTADAVRLALLYLI